MPEYTLRIRRYDPQSGEAPHWDTHTVDLSPVQSVLDAILKIKDDAGRLDRHPLLLPAGDLRLVRRAHERQARPGLQHPPRRGRRARARHGLESARRGPAGAGHHGRADGQHAGHPGPDRRHGRGALEEDPPRHPVADQQGAGSRARVHRPPREHGRRHPDDGLHPVRGVRVGLPGHGGRSAVRRAGRAGQGLPVRRRPARRAAGRAPARPLRGPARALRLHPLLQLHRRLPQGRRSDEPDHAPAPRGRVRPPTSRTATTATATSTRSSRTSAGTASCTSRISWPTPTAASSTRRAGAASWSAGSRPP